MLPMKWPWQWSCLGFMEIAMAEGHRRDCATAVSQSRILGAGIIMHGYHPSFHMNSPPMRQQISPKVEASRLCFQRTFMAVCSMPCVTAFCCVLQPSAWFTWTVLIPHCPAGNSNHGALLCFIFPSFSPVLSQGGWKVIRHLQCLSPLC